MFLLRTNSLVVILSLILFHGKYIFGLGTEKFKAINVLAKLNNTAAGCDLHDFLRLDSDFKNLSDDLTKYCSPSKLVKRFRILCHMLSYELEIACALPAKSRPSKALYTSNTSAKEICDRKNIQLTNQWIWDKLTNGGQKDIGITAKYLCDSVTNYTVTLRLARFFYKIAPLIRQADLSQQASDKGQSHSIVSISGAAKDTKTGNADVAPTSKEKSQQSIETKAKETGEGTKGKANQTEEGTKDKAAQPGEQAKDKTNEGTKDQAAQIGEGIKDKAAQTGEGVKDKTAQTGEGAKDKIAQTGEGIKEKAGEGEKLNVSANIISNKDNKTDLIQGNVDKGKPSEESLSNKTIEKTELRKNATNELSPKTDENGQKVLDLNKDNKSELENKKDQASADDEDNDEDDNGDKISKEAEQAAQIPKPDLVNKKEGETEIDKTKDVKGAIVNETSNLANQDKKKDKETNNDRDMKSNDPNDGPEEDEVDNDTDEDSMKQLRDQQKESDKDDLRSAVGDKEKAADNEHIPPDDYGTANDSDQQVKTVDPSNDDEDAEDQGINRDPSGMNIRKPTDEDRTGFGKTAEKNTKNSGSESSKTRPKAPVSRKYADDDGWSGSFVTYFLLFTLFVVIGYLVLHHKNKLMAYVVEGRRSGAPRSGSRPSHRGYEKLKNVNDIIPIDNINPISDKVIILKT
ncbi:unnamed protein product [Rotaria socialis]|uniref:Trans-Golgi network integral membrane protein 2 n=1 Tax=Rotaria socialis TaxID=392032 RepID=A0A820QRK1_9BILA|nr:unnamed protein product [Rotaria socialis]